MSTPNAIRAGQLTVQRPELPWHRALRQPGMSSRGPLAGNNQQTKTTVVWFGLNFRFGLRSPSSRHHHHHHDKRHRRFSHHRPSHSTLHALCTEYQKVVPFCLGCGVVLCQPTFRRDWHILPQILCSPFLLWNVIRCARQIGLVAGDRLHE